MSEFVPKEPAKVVIGVCGEQGSGKTVFLTCIFQSVATAFPDDVIVDFDRKEVGGANYFQSIEDSLIAKGPTEGTVVQSLFPARIYVKPYGPLPGTVSPVLSVDILDFAGRHFRSMADLKDLLESSDADPDDVKALREVNETLERADAFVILISSREIDPREEVPKRNPFSPSVNFMLAHCRAERKPVALLFSQIDQTPTLDEELFRSLPRVKRFEGQFTSDLEESLQGGRPYGIARRISCYETIPGDLAPRRQTLDGSIWRPEPAEVILDLLRAAMPRINERLAREAAEAAEAEEEKQREESRKQKRQWTLRAAAVLGSLMILGLLFVAWYKRTEGHQARLIDGIESSVRAGSLAAIPAAAEAQLVQLLAAYRADPGGTPSGVRSEIEELEAAFEQAAQRLAGDPVLDNAYGAEVARFQGLVPHFDPVMTGPWQQTLLPLLAARSEFLTDWFGTERTERRVRTGFLDDAAKRFESRGDRAFSGVLSLQSTREKEAEVAGWQAQIDADPDVASRLATIQRLLAGAVAQKDPELLRLARKALAGHLVSTLLKRQENGVLRDKLLTPIAPDLSQLGDGEVRFEVLARDVLACTDAAECGNREGVVQTAIQEADAAVGNWSAGIDNLLRSLLLDLPPGERLEVWGALAEALAGAYLFSPREDAWPSGLQPLAKTILPAAGGESDATEALIERIAQHPIYEAELRYLADRLTAIAASRRVVPIYSTLLSTLTDSGSVLPTDGLAEASQQVTSALADRDGDGGSLAAIGSEIEQILLLAQSVNDSRTRSGLGDASAAERLRRLLQEAKRSHCTMLASYEAPAECDDAA